MENGENLSKCFIHLGVVRRLTGHELTPFKYSSIDNISAYVVLVDYDLVWASFRSILFYEKITKEPLFLISVKKYFPFRKEHFQQSLSGKKDPSRG